MTTVPQSSSYSDVDAKTERFCYVVALIWGGIWALFLSLTDFGRFLADRRTWLTVVGGVAGNLLILRPLMPTRVWDRVFNVFALSSIFLIARSLYREILFAKEIERGAKNSHECET